MDSPSDSTGVLPPGWNIRDVPDEVLSSILQQSMLEIKRRNTIKTAWNDLNNCVIEYQKAVGLKDASWFPGQTMAVYDWQKPETALESYCIGDRVTHNGDMWQSMQPINSVEPGTDDDAWWRVDRDNNNILVDPYGGSSVV